MKANIVVEDCHGWIPASNYVRPSHGQLCLLIHHYGEKSVTVGQYISENLQGCHKEPYFVCLTGIWEAINLGCEEWEPGFSEMGIIEYWKPLVLPEEIEKHIRKRIDSWFEEEE